MKLKNPIGLVWSFLKKKKIEEALLNSKNQIKTRKSFRRYCCGIFGFIRRAGGATFWTPKMFEGYDLF